MSLSLHAVTPFIGRGVERLRPIPAGTFLLVLNGPDKELCVIDINNPSNTSPPYGRRGSIITNSTIYSSFSYGGHLYVIDSGEKLYRVNVHDPADLSEPYGLVGSIDTNRRIKIVKSGATVMGQDILITGEDSDDSNIRLALWRLNPDDWSAPTRVGLFPYERATAGAQTYWSIAGRGLASLGTKLYTFGYWGHLRKLFRINPSSPTTTSSPYGDKGEVLWPISGEGEMVSEGTGIYATARPAGDNTARLYRINPDDPDSNQSPYGDQGVLPSYMRYTNPLCFHTITS